MAQYVVTGGAGFIGSHIIQELVRRRQKVKVIDRPEQAKNLAGIKSKINFIAGDIQDAKLLQKEFKGADFVLHQAALCSVAGSIDDPLSSNDTNITGTLNVLLAARDNKIKRVVFASSSAVYGNNPSPLKKEEMAVQPLSPYALSKVADELYARVFFELYGLETVGLRYFNVFGPGQNPNGPYAAAVPKFLQAMLSGEQPVIYGNGEQSRDFIYVKNVVEANLLAITAPKAAGKVFNVAGGKSVSLNKLMAMINQILKTKINPVYEKPRPGDILHSAADISLAKKFLKYQPRINFLTGLKETITWYQKNH